MKNTLENKAKFFAQYWGQKVLNFNDSGAISNARYEVQGDMDENMFLELKPLSIISDEDAVKLGYGNSQHLRSSILYNIDELRQLGYAIDWCGLSVEQLVEYGWIKLKAQSL
jgi:hypothetical protein